MIDRRDWQLDFHYRENGRGEEYYKSGCVKFIEKYGNIVNAVVLDEYEFKVKIKLFEDKYVSSISCECGGQSCEHMAACLHLLSNEEVPNNEVKFCEIDEIIHNLENDDLINFVKKQLKNDYNFYREFKKEFILL
ncbi:MAG: hypothetical protein IJG09_06250 [Methanobrevibacter sp.]|nr:hypothetical protein [Methanobrevibacter sp.]